MIWEYPGDGWRSLPQVNIPISDSARVIAWFLNLGKALSVLASHGLAPDFSSLTEYLEPLVVTQGEEIEFADLAVFKRLEVQPEGAGDGKIEAAQQKALRYIAQLL